MFATAPNPLLETAIRLALLPIPTALVEFAFNRLARSIASRHASMFERLGSHVGKRFVLQPTDLPFLFVVTLDPVAPAVSIVRPSGELRSDARIAGPIAALVGLAHGCYDGDAMFFSGDLTVEGDIEAILALRNALDNAEIDLLEEGAAMLGLLSGAVEGVMRPAALLIESHTGFPLTRTRHRHP